MALADFQNLFADLIRDVDAVIVDGERDRAIDLAAQRYSSDRPRRLIADITADGANQLDPPADWLDGFSRLLQAEYPLAEVPPAYLASGRYGVYESPAGEKIQFLDAPAAAADVRLTFTAKHVLGAAEDTIPERDREAVASYAAAVALDQLATRHAADGEPTIQADSVNGQSKGQAYASRARSLRQRYFEVMGEKPNRQAPAAAIVDVDLTSGQGGRDLLFHKGANR